ncbi:MAG: hypothetical protein WC729_09290 [Sphingomonas sp.]|uniref:hypothetical protein n=1 Tax=Sphingomonas sp. TaxID=28214 RepID=UPI003569C578
MRAEDVARDAQFREGFTLVDYAEVGLPIFRLTIEAVTTTTRTLPTIQEFAMRCMALGETEEATIARMLGLKEDIVRGAVDSLVLDGYVARTAIISSFSSFALTQSGLDRLGQEAQEVVQEEMIVVDYDAIRRMPVKLAGENVVRAAELKIFGAVEIRPYPSDPPNVSELSIPDVRRVIRRQSGDDFRHNVLALKRVVRRNNVFREAVALVFAADKGDEVQVAFAIDGRLSESHEHSFAENGGPRKMGFVRMIGDDGARRRLDRLVGRDAVRSLPDPQSLRGVRKEEAEARAQVRSIEPAVETGRSRRSANPAVPALAAAKERLAVAMHELDTIQLRPLACYEQGELLAEAIANATKSLLVTSAGLQSSILTQHIMRDLERLAGSRVAITVASFLKPQLEPRGGDFYDPLAEISKQAQKGRMQIATTPRSDFFFLIRDQDLAVISNRPFLGEMVRRSGFQRVEGFVTRDRSIVEKIKAMAADAAAPRRRA